MTESHDDDFTSEMDPEYWSKKWEADHGELFHLNKLNGLLTKYIGRMTKEKKSLKFLFPFCGKDICMKWLVDQGHSVVGCDCAPQAFKDFAKEQNIQFTESKIVDFTVYSSHEGKLKLYCGDYYKFSESHEGQFDIIWDRGGFNAVNASEQIKYRDLALSLMSPTCEYYLINFDMQNQEESEKMGLLTDKVIQDFFGSEKMKVELRVEFVPATYYNGDLCKDMDGWMEKLSIITWRK